MGQIKKITTGVTAGQSAVTIPELAYVTVLSVSREGIFLDPSDVTPENRQYQHIPYTGTIKVNQFVPFNEGETLNITYQR